MADFVLRASRPLAIALAPLIVPQGRQVDRDLPKLPEAAGPRSGVAGDGPPLSLLVIGESTAAGVGVAQVTDSVAGQLAAMMSARGVAVSWQVLGATGSTAAKTLSRWVPRVTDRYDVVLVMLGVNDVLAMTPAGQWRATVRAILTALGARLTEQGRIVLSGVPRVDTFPSLPQPLRSVLGLHARALDQELVELARRLDRVRHLPTAPVRDDHFLSCDRFHPSASGYHEWAQTVVEDGLADWPWPVSPPSV